MQITRPELCSKPSNDTSPGVISLFLILAQPLAAQWLWPRADMLKLTKKPMAVPTHIWHIHLLWLCVVAVGGAYI